LQCFASLLWNANLAAAALCDERVDSRFYRFAKAFWRGSCEHSTPPADSFAFDTDRMMAMVEKIIPTIAAEGLWRTRPNRDRSQLVTRGSRQGLRS
jgi:hypothetical protein